MKCLALGLTVLFLAAVAIGCSGDKVASSGPSDKDANTESSGTVASKKSGDTGATTESGDVDPSMEETPPADDAEPSEEPVAREGEVALYLHADATVTSSPGPGQALSPEELRKALTEAVERFREAESAATPENGDGGVRLAISGFRPTGPTVNIVADPGATYGNLDGLLKICVNCQCEKYVLKNAHGGRPYSFALRCQGARSAAPDPHQLPPMKLRMKADEDGLVDQIWLNQKQVREFAALQGYLRGIIGDRRGPTSLQASIELKMQCDAGLKLKHLFDGLEAVSGYTAGDGTRVALVEKIRPVAWGGGEMEEIEVFEEKEIQEIDVTTTKIVSEAIRLPRTDIVEEEDISPQANAPDAPPLAVELQPSDEPKVPKDHRVSHVGSSTGSGFACRSPAARAEMVRQYGGNAASEAAVAAALKWLAAHQYPDGSWNFDHTRGPCQGRCPNPGDLREAPRAATAMALLPLLGAGQTHTEGHYKVLVKRGLDFLVKNMKVGGGTGSFEESGGRMYAHGLASIAICEAYALTRDKALLQPAQLSLNHISYAQDPVGGGWRYSPKQPGDTSVLSWQLMALKTGHMGYLQVHPNTVKGATKFLDSVQANKGAMYGYTGPATGRNATTAIGLLSRMYLGWKKDNPALKEGVKYLSNTGPSKTNMYYNYYATQVMRQYDGDLWKKWNVLMRDYLTDAQAKDGHAMGSWHFGGGDHGALKGGRVYCTSIATMILEVYYRNPPIYKEPAADD